MKIKVTVAKGVGAQGVIAAQAGPLYATLGSTRYAVVELRSVERNETIAPDKEEWVALSIEAVEIANGDQEDTLRRAMAALYLQRTAAGTLDEAGEVRLSDETLRGCAGELAAIEASRLHVAVARWHDHTRTMLASRASADSLRVELRKLANGLDAALTGSAIEQ